MTPSRLRQSPDLQVRAVKVVETDKAEERGHKQVQGYLAHKKQQPPSPVGPP